MKKTLVTATIAATLLIAAPAQAAGNFSDITSKYSWATEAIDFLVDQGAVKGFADGTFKPSNIITKAEFAHMYNLLLPMEREGADKPPVFVDVKSTHWAADDFSALFNQDPWMYMENWVRNGNGGEKLYLNPDKQLTRWDIMLLIAFLTEDLLRSADEISDQEKLKEMSIFKDVTVREYQDSDANYFISYYDGSEAGLILHWEDMTFEGDFEAPIEAFYAILKSGVMQGSDGYFRPNDKVTRAEAATILYRTYKALTAF